MTTLFQETRLFDTILHANSSHFRCISRTSKLAFEDYFSPWPFQLTCLPLAIDHWPVDLIVSWMDSIVRQSSASPWDPWAIPVINGLKMIEPVVPICLVIPCLSLSCRTEPRWQYVALESDASEVVLWWRLCTLDGDAWVFGTPPDYPGQH